MLSNSPISYSPDHIVAHDLCTGCKVTLLPKRNDWLDGRTAALFLPDGEYVAVILTDHRVVYVWEASTGLCVGSLSLDPWARKTLTFTQHGDLCYLSAAGTFAVVRFQEFIRSLLPKRYATAMYNPTKIHYREHQDQYPTAASVTVRSTAPQTSPLPDPRRRHPPKPPPLPLAAP